MKTTGKRWLNKNKFKMKEEVTAIFDIGKTNKKFLLFNNKLQLIHQEEIVFEEVEDDDGFPCDDIDKLITWAHSSIEKTVQENKFEIKYLNFTTYGASMIYLNKKGKRITPLYNYLKPMPDNVINGFYERYGGQEEFSRNTASPALGMLNSGLQILWLKKKKPEFWSDVHDILHLPQFISYLFTKAIVSGYPSIGCHTALWDFDNMEYHPWLKDEKITLPKPVNSDILYPVNIGGTTIHTGVGIHDSSASLVPYLKAFKDNKFILVSTGTWAINMNPFSKEQLSIDELKNDCLCYLSVDKQQVKSSRLFLGHIHEVNVNILCKHSGITNDVFKSIKANEELLTELIKKDTDLIFPEGMTENYISKEDALFHCEEPVKAYHQFMYEITKMEVNAIKLVFDQDDNTNNIYITGGFVKNDIFCKLLATFLKDKKVFKAELYNATALGTAMIANKNLNTSDVEINLEEIKPLNI